MLLHSCNFGVDRPLFCTCGLPLVPQPPLCLCLDFCDTEMILGQQRCFGVVSGLAKSSEIFALYKPSVALITGSNLHSQMLMLVKPCSLWAGVFFL